MATCKSPHTHTTHAPVPIVQRPAQLGFHPPLHHLAEVALDAHPQQPLCVAAALRCVANNVVLSNGGADLAFHVLRDGYLRRLQLLRHDGHVLPAGLPRVHLVRHALLRGALLLHDCLQLLVHVSPVQPSRCRRPIHLEPGRANRIRRAGAFREHREIRHAAGVTRQCGWRHTACGRAQRRGGSRAARPATT